VFYFLINVLTANISKDSSVRNFFGCQKKMNEYGFKLTEDLRTGLNKTIDYFMKSH